MEALLVARQDRESEIYSLKLTLMSRAFDRLRNDSTRVRCLADYAVGARSYARQQ